MSLSDVIFLFTYNMYKQATFFLAGRVVLTENVLRHHASATYDLSITANDGYNTIGPRTLTVNINGMLNHIA